MLSPRFYRGESLFSTIFLGRPMELLDKFLRRILSFGVVLGSIFMLAMMVAIDGNVLLRLMGGVLPGSFELSELFIVVSVAFALGYAALHKSHVDVKIVVEKFSDRGQAIVEIITSFFAMVIWGLTAWAGGIVMFERWGTELTEMLGVPNGPFRLVLTIGLILITLVYFLDMISAFKKAVQK